MSNSGEFTSGGVTRVTSLPPATSGLTGNLYYLGVATVDLEVGYYIVISDGGSGYSWVQFGKRPDIKETYITIAEQTSSVTISLADSTVIPCDTTLSSFTVTLDETSAEPGSRYRIQDTGGNCAVNPVYVEDMIGNPLQRVDTNDGAVEYVWTGFSWQIIDKFENMWDRNPVSGETSLASPADTLVANAIRNNNNSASLSSNGDFVVSSGAFGTPGSTVTKTIADGINIGVNVNQLPGSFGNAPATINFSNQIYNGTEGTEAPGGSFNIWWVSSAVKGNTSAKNILLEFVDGDTQSIGSYNTGAQDTVIQAILDLGSIKHITYMSSGYANTGGMSVYGRNDFNGTSDGTLNGWTLIRALSNNSGGAVNVNYQFIAMVVNNGTSTSNGYWFNLTGNGYQAFVNTTEVLVDTGTGAFDPSTLKVYDENNILLTGPGKVNIAVKTDGGSFSSLEDQVLFRGEVTPRPILEYATDISLQFQTVNEIRWSYFTLTTPNTTIKIENTGDLNLKDGETIISNVSKKGISPVSLTTAERDALTGVRNGSMIFNTDTKKVNFFTGSVWEESGIDFVGGTSYSPANPDALETDYPAATNGGKCSIIWSGTALDGFYKSNGTIWVKLFDDSGDRTSLWDYSANDDIDAVRSINKLHVRLESIESSVSADGVNLPNKTTAEIELDTSAPDGRLVYDSTLDVVKERVNGAWLRSDRVTPISYTQAQIDALTGMTTGTMLFNSTTSTVVNYDGVKWVGTGIEFVTGSTYSDSAALEIAHPAASNSGKFALMVGSNAFDGLYKSNGVSWAKLIDNPGNREDLWDYDAGLVAYEATNSFTGGVPSSSVAPAGGVVASAFDGNNSTAVTLVANNRVEYTLGTAKALKKLLVTIQSTAGNHNQTQYKFQGLQSGVWYDIPYTSIEITGAATIAASNGIMFTLSSAVVLSTVTVLSSNSTAYEAYGVYCVYTSGNNQFSIRNFEGFGASPDVAPTINCVNSINSLNNKILGLESVVSTDGINLPNKTSVELAALTPAVGSTAYNTTTNKLNTFNGTEWVEPGIEFVGGSTYSPADLDALEVDYPAADNTGKWALLWNNLALDGIYRSNGSLWVKRLDDSGDRTELFSYGAGNVYLTTDELDVSETSGNSYLADGTNFKVNNDSAGAGATPNGWFSPSASAGTVALRPFYAARIWNSESKKIGKFNFGQNDTYWSCTAFKIIGYKSVVSSMADIMNSSNYDVLTPVTLEPIAGTGSWTWGINGDGKTIERLTSSGGGTAWLNVTTDNTSNYVGYGVIVLSSSGATGFYYGMKGYEVIDGTETQDVVDAVNILNARLLPVETVVSTSGVDLPNKTTAEVTADSSAPNGRLVYDSNKHIIMERINGVWVESGKYVPPSYTQVEIDALTGMAAGSLVFNTTTSKLNNYNGTEWLETGIEFVGGSTYSPATPTILEADYPAADHPGKCCLIWAGTALDGFYKSNGTVWGKLFDDSGDRTTLWDYAAGVTYGASNLMTASGTAYARNDADSADVTIMSGSAATPFDGLNNDALRVSAAYFPFISYKIYDVLPDALGKFEVQMFGSGVDGGATLQSFEIIGKTSGGAIETLLPVSVSTTNGAHTASLVSGSNGDSKISLSTIAISAEKITINTSNMTRYVGYGIRVFTAGSSTYFSEILGYTSISATDAIDCVRSINKLNTRLLVAESDLLAKVSTSLVGAVSGIASLDGSGKVPSSQLPSFVDDVLEYADFASLPVTGEGGKIYITLDDNKTFRWSGSVYIQVGTSLVLGVLDTTAYRGDYGNTAYLHSQATSGNPHNVNLSDLAAFNITAVADGQILSYDNGTSKWINIDLSASIIPNLDWSKITTGKPTTLAGYGITDANQPIDISSVTTASTTLNTTDHFKAFFINYTGGTHVITIPSSLPVGFNCTFLNEHATNSVSFVPGGGVTITSKNGTFLPGENSSCSLIVKSSGQVYLIGGLLPS